MKGEPGQSSAIQGGDERPDSRLFTAQTLKDKGLFEGVQLVGKYFGRLSSVAVYDGDGNLIASHPPQS